MAKKRWITLCYECKRKPNTKQIIWNSTSSGDKCSDEELMYNENDYKKSDHLETGCNCSESSLTFAESCIPSGNSQQSPTVKHRYVDLSNVSPELVSQRNSNRTPSPVIETRRWLQIRKKLKFDNANTVKVPCSPEIFCPSPSPNEEKQSKLVKKDLFLQYTPESTEETFKFSQTPDTQSSTTDSNESQTEIEPFESQLGTAVEVEKNIPLKVCYLKEKKHKTKYKKGTIAYQLHYALQIKKAKINIWHHEQRKKASREDSVISFKCLSWWTEYGVKFLECDTVFSAIEKTFIVNLGVTQLLHVDFEMGILYELYAPYNIGSVRHGDEEVPYYYSVSKIIRSKSQRPC